MKRVYRFGALFAPFISCLATFIGIRAGTNIDMQENPLKMLLSIIVAMYAVLGFTMYSLEITSVAMFCLAISIYIVGILSTVVTRKHQNQMITFGKVDIFYEK